MLVHLQICGDFFKYTRHVTIHEAGQPTESNACEEINHTLEAEPIEVLREEIEIHKASSFFKKKIPTAIEPSSRG